MLELTGASSKGELSVGGWISTGRWPISNLTALNHGIIFMAALC
jgi:hypothetical protein